jgi:hypothetical protein
MAGGLTPRGSLQDVRSVHMWLAGHRCGALRLRQPLYLMVLSAGIVWFLGKHLNGDSDAEDARHLCMGMRLQNAAVISLGFLGLSFF